MAKITKIVRDVGLSGIIFLFLLLAAIAWLAKDDADYWDMVYYHPKRKIEPVKLPWKQRARVAWDSFWRRIRSDSTSSPGDT